MGVCVVCVCVCILVFTKDRRQTQKLPPEDIVGHWQKKKHIILTGKRLFIGFYSVGTGRYFSLKENFGI